jgi:hypothetical protein
MSPALRWTPEQGGFVDMRTDPNTTAHGWSKADQPFYARSDLGALRAEE